MNKFLSSALALAIIFTPLTCSANVLLAQESVVKPNVQTEQIQTNQVSTNNLPYNYESTYRVPIKLAITEEISTKEGIIEGKPIQLKVLNDVYCRRKTFLKKGTLINARVETTVTSGMNGFPAEIIVGDFEIPNARQSQLQDTYIKKGQNRCYWVYPLKWSLTLIPFVGSLTNLIKGGHAKLKTTDEIVIYYYPDWK